MSLTGDSKAQWDQRSAKMIRLELARRDWRVSDLAKALSAEGFEVSEASLYNKLSRGSFSAGFLLRVFAALGSKGEDLGRVFDLTESAR